MFFFRKINIDFKFTLDYIFNDIEIMELQ